MDIKINAETPGFTKPTIILICIQYPRKKYKIQPVSYHVKMYPLIFEKPVWISGVDSVISIELNID